MFLGEAVTKRIVEIMKEYHLNASKWSTKAGITPSTLYDIKKKKSSCPDLYTIRKLCDAIKMPITEFFNVDYILKSELEDDFL